MRPLMNALIAAVTGHGLPSGRVQLHDTKKRRSIRRLINSDIEMESVPLSDRCFNGEMSSG